MSTRADDVPRSVAASEKQKDRLIKVRAEARARLGRKIQSQLFHCKTPTRRLFHQQPNTCLPQAAPRSHRWQRNAGERRSKGLLTNPKRKRKVVGDICQKDSGKASRSGIPEYDLRDLRQAYRVSPISEVVKPKHLFERDGCFTVVLLCNPYAPRQKDSSESSVSFWMQWYGLGDL